MAEESTPKPLDPRAKLRAIVDAFPGQGFALVDGGHFDDLPALFKREHLFARSLFLDTADLAVQAAGPWLVKLDQAPAATDKIFALVGDKPAVVFWCCQAGEMVLWRHLRTLNMARIPVWAANGGTEPPDDPAQIDQYEASMFRHWDPRVLGALLPVLHAAQFARLLRPAEEIAFWAEAHGGAKRVLADQNWPAAASGFLTINSSQTIRLSERRLAASHGRIAAYLRDAAPGEATSLSQDALLDHVAHSRSIGLELGLSSERAHAKWAYLMLMTQGGIATSPGVCPFIKAPNRNPDKQMDIFMLSLVAAKQRLGEP